VCDVSANSFAHERDGERNLSKLRLNRNFRPCFVDRGEELFANGIFVFNITRLLAFIETHREHFPIEMLQLSDIPFSSVSHLDQATIDAADVFRPVLMAEISPGRYNLIDGQHRVARARRENLARIAAYRMNCPDHVRFLTSNRAYESYVRYWNSKAEGKRG